MKMPWKLKRLVPASSYEIRRLQQEEQIRESPIHRPTPEDVRRYDPTTRALDSAVEREEARERRKRWFDGFKAFVAALTAIREVLDRIRNARRGGPPPEEGKG